MKPSTSLEQEREALLEQIHSSRAAYRRMLAQYDQPERSSGSAAYGNDKRIVPPEVHVRGMPAAFPRSRSLRWAFTHPWAMAGAAAAVVAVAALTPRVIGKGVKSVRHRMRKEDPPQVVQSGPWRGAPVVREVVVQKPSTAGAALAGMMGLATMALRDPQRMRMAIQTASKAWNWVQTQRQQAERMRSRRQKEWSQREWNRSA